MILEAFATWVATFQYDIMVFNSSSVMNHIAGRERPRSIHHRLLVVMMMMIQLQTHRLLVVVVDVGEILCLVLVMGPFLTMGSQGDRARDRA